LFEHDQFADLDLRSTVGTGPGYQFFESEALNLSVSAGPAWVDEDFDEAEDEDYAAGQWLFSYDQFFSTRVSNCFTDR
jgi:putative salt-induced outer membrane protein YdiY